MINVTARDGPLLIFCQLGHLVATAVPLSRSGLELKDIEKVWELQRKMIEGKRLPLSRASYIVWEALGQQREQVNDLCLKNTDGDREILHRLLGMIDDALYLRYSGAEGFSQSELAEEQEPKSVAVAIGPSSGTQSGEGEGGFGRECFINFLELLLTFRQIFPRIKFHVVRK